MTHAAAEASPELSQGQFFSENKVEESLLKILQVECVTAFFSFFFLMKWPS